MLEEDGWFLMTTKGDHRQYKHPTKKSKVTVRGKPSETLDQFLLNSIWISHLPYPQIKNDIIYYNGCD